MRILLAVILSGTMSLASPEAIDQARLNLAATDLVYLASPKGIDNARLNMTVNHLKELYPNNKVVQQDDLEGGLATVVEVYDIHNKLIFDAQIEEGKVYNLSSDNPAVRTAEGIGPGSVIESANKNYGKPTLVHGEGLTCAVYKKKPGLSFCLDREVKLIESIAVVHRVK